MAKEALGRGHALTAVVRNPSRLTLSHERLAVTQGDAADPASVAAAGHDAAVGSLEVAPGVRLVDTPAFPAEYKAEALAQAEALELFRSSTENVEMELSQPASHHSTRAAYRPISNRQRPTPHGR